MKLWIVSQLTCAGYECDPLPTPIGVAATPLDALDIIERDAGRQEDGTFRSRNPLRFVIGGPRHSCDDDNYTLWGYKCSQQVRMEIEYLNERTGETAWSDSYQSWYVDEVELQGFDREAMLAAIRLYDIEHGRIAPARSEWDHVHRVKPDEQGTG